MSFNPINSLTLLATVDDWSNVADHVHCDTIVVAVNPIETFPPTTTSTTFQSQIINPDQTCIKCGVQVIRVMVDIFPDLEYHKIFESVLDLESLPVGKPEQCPQQKLQLQ